MAETFEQLTFSPSIEEILIEQKGKKVTVFTGVNNSGKSAYLKNFALNKEYTYIGVNRFYSFHYFEFFNYNERELDDFQANMRNQRRTKHSNFEGMLVDMNRALAQLPDTRRNVLFKVFEELFGYKMGIKLEFPKNAMSRRYISVDGESLSVTSSGTRLFVGVLALLMDERFKTIAIDEPELGLSPPLQSRLSHLMIDGDYRKRLFPHDPMFIISTHSHLFLDKSDFTNNFTVTRDKNAITAKRCASVDEFYKIQLNMLGNELRDLFLPDAVVFVEGPTDKRFLETVCRLSFPGVRVVIEQCGGDIAARLNFWAQALGDFQVSPYRGRTFFVEDLIKQSGIERTISHLGLPDQASVNWTRNGIEYVYPLRLLREIYHAPAMTYDDLQMNGDHLSHSGISYKKAELCALVCDKLTRADCETGELHTQFVERLQRVFAAA